MATQSDHVVGGSGVEPDLKYEAYFGGPLLIALVYH